MSKKEKSNEKLIKLALATGIVSLIEKMIELLIRLIELVWGQ